LPSRYTALGSREACIPRGNTLLSKGCGGLSQWKTRTANVRLQSMQANCDISFSLLNGRYWGVQSATAGPIRPAFPL
jgi:hypothetical protein